MIRTSINSQIWVCESLSHPAHLVNWKRSTTFLHLKAKVLVPHAQTHQYWELCAWMDLTSFLNNKTLSPKLYSKIYGVHGKIKCVDTMTTNKELNLGEEQQGCSGQ